MIRFGRSRRTYRWGMPSLIAARLRRALPRVRWTRRRVIAGAVVVVLVLGLVGWAVAPTPASYRTFDQMITVQTGPDGNTPVTLDTRLYLPKSAGAGRPVPAILLAHGFGGTKEAWRATPRTSPTSATRC